MYRNYCDICVISRDARIREKKNKTNPKNCYSNYYYKPPGGPLIYGKRLEEKNIYKKVPTRCRCCCRCSCCCCSYDIYIPTYYYNSIRHRYQNYYYTCTVSYYHYHNVYNAYRWPALGTDCRARAYALFIPGTCVLY